MKTISTDEKAERVWEVALFENPVEDPMHAYPSDDAPITARNSHDIIVQIARSQMKDLNAQEVDRVYAERSQAEVKTQIKEGLVDMLQVGDSGAANRI